MYLKSIEVQGFKSFANKIVFQFHNGITAIVGPNGSGKSNVADAVRWVLGEQSARSLRGSSMQDVIFAGTEARRPLNYAAVSITLDNSDHTLNVPYEELTVTRRVYRSGESEYLLNGTQVRLKDINEIFYDTGIGKEGYSIIGQGQIDKILSDKPEDRRELFDEAAGIVKFKRRKQSAMKRLDAERQNLTRVSDILSEIGRQLGPLEKQAETAKIYLEKRDRLKICDVNLFLLDYSRQKKSLDELTAKQEDLDAQLKEAQEEYNRSRTAYEAAEQEIARSDALLKQKRDESSAAALDRAQLENQIQLLNEQINTAMTSDEHLSSQIRAIKERLADFDRQRQKAEEELQEQSAQLEASEKEADSRNRRLNQIRGTNRLDEQQVESAKASLIDLLNRRATVKAQMQRYDTMLEQTQIRRAQLTQELLKLKSDTDDQKTRRGRMEKDYDSLRASAEELERKSRALDQSAGDLKSKLSQLTKSRDEAHTRCLKDASRLESLRNIAERYDGYGSGIRRVMERKEQNPGILGVVADLIRVDEKYETAVETALGGAIQNIVTDSEKTAKEQIAFLKNNRYGRATFLPLDGISGQGRFSSPDALKEAGVIGLASALVQTDKKYRALTDSLLGRTVVCDTVDHAIALARKYRHSLRIVTLEGELLSPGGSISGGAYKNSGNLLGRRREIEELQSQLGAEETALNQLQAEMENTRAAQNEAADEAARLRDELQRQLLAQNTAKLQLDELTGKAKDSADRVQRLEEEDREIDAQIAEIRENQAREQAQLADSEREEQALTASIDELQQKLDAGRASESEADSAAQQSRLLLGKLEQAEQFTRQNLERIRSECESLSAEQAGYERQIETEAGNVKERREQIAAIEDKIAGADAADASLKEEISRLEQAREEKAAANRQFFSEREELSGQISALDKESFRLQSQTEKITEQSDSRINYIWEEYGLTYSSAKELRDESAGSAAALRKDINTLKNEIRELGSVNVNAIEDYRELSERFSFLTSQQEDLKKAERDLVKIIDDLDAGMRSQFTSEFSKIQTEFNKTFKELFGGGKGTLELVEGEDVLTAGVRIIAQPPGKKLQNMMQLSGGEKSLTAIALLFAIQNLKPSPFCLLDEIEAALDESNVERYANYLHRLTKNTQFIIITHRRGTMAAADRLYGITMQEKGVSALVSVNLIEDELE